MFSIIRRTYIFSQHHWGRDKYSIKNVYTQMIRGYDIQNNIIR